MGNALKRRLVAAVAVAISLCSVDVPAGYRPPGGGKQLFSFASSDVEFANGTHHWIVAPNGFVTNASFAGNNNPCDSRSTMTMAYAGTLRKLSIGLDCCISAGQVVYKLGVPTGGCPGEGTAPATALTCTQTSGSNTCGCSDSSGSVHVAAASVVGLDVAATSSPNQSCGGSHFTFEFDPD